MAVTLESLKKSVGKKNSKSKIFAWLADLELAAGDLDSALQRINGGLTLYPNDIAAKIVRAKILFQKGDFEDCVRECESILVKDPFSLAGQKIMGDAYDQLGNVVERNLCYRRYHDMDPLNKFWKDEYDVVPETASADAAVAAAMAGTDFSMPSDESLDLGLSEPTGEEFSADSQENDFGLFEKSSESESNLLHADETEVESSIEKAFGDTFGDESNDALESGESYEASSLPGSSPFSSSFLDEPMEQTPAAGQTDSLSAGFDMPAFGSESASDDSESMSDDPFAALAAMLPNSDAADDATMDELSASLDSVMDDIKSDVDIDKPVEEFPVDENVSGNDVNAAISDMFGLDDDLEAEETAPAASFSIDSVDAKAEENASKIFETQVSADKPQSVDDAFSSIFGEDELPEEKPAVEPAAPTADKPLSVDDAFDSIFGEDDLPEEKPVEAPLASAPAVEEPAPADVAPSAEPAAPAADKPLSVDDAFDSIFGEDDLPEEKPVEAPLASAPAVEEPASADVAPSVEPAAPVADKPLSVDDAFDSIFGEDDLPEEKPVDNLSETLDAPKDEPVSAGEWSPTPVASEEPALEESAPAAEPAAPAADKPLSVDDAFDSIFGEDDLPEEKPVATEEPKFVAEVDVPSDPVISSPMDFVNDENSEVGNAFDSLFGAEDDVPEEKASAPAEVSAFAETSLAEQVDQAESELELPSMDKKQESSDIAQEMGGAFASMFGDDDDLDLPDLKGDGKTESAAVDESQQATSAAFEESLTMPAEENLSNDLDKSFDSLFGSDDDLSLPSEEKPVAGNPDLSSLETEVSGAFKGLFDMEDDSLEGESKPSNSGVDFLMSGDSDDEISAGLIKNPEASLDRSVNNLDDSMGTRTLAEIYFDQGLYGEALKMYQELVQREPDNAELAVRKDEIEKIYRDKFGGNA